MSFALTAMPFEWKKDQHFNPLVRQSISQAIKSINQSTNQSIHQSSNTSIHQSFSQ